MGKKRVLGRAKNKNNLPENNTGFSKGWFWAALTKTLNRTKIKSEVVRSQEFSTPTRVIIKAGSKGQESGPKVGSKFGQLNNNI